jgi:hypothetical protein
MHNGEPAIDAVLKMGQELQKLEDSVMKVALDISEHFQWKKIVEQVDQESEDLNKRIAMFADALRQMPCLAFNAEEVHEQQLNHVELKRQIEVLRELVITFEIKAKQYESQLFALDLIQQLKMQLENVKVNFAHLTRLLDDRQKLLNSASQYYKCLATALPAIEWVKKMYSDENSDVCEKEQNEELTKRLESIRNRIQSHRSHRQKFMQALDFAIRCAGQFHTRLKRLEDNYLNIHDRFMRERCQKLQQQVNGRCEDIRCRQNQLVQVWTQRNDEMLVCEKTCLLEILAKQVRINVNAEHYKYFTDHRVLRK